MRIREATHTDKENISRLHIASIKELCQNHYTIEQLNAWTTILVPSVYNQALQEKIILVACNSEQALQGLGILDVNHSEVSAIYVHPAAVGKGLGSKLLKELEEVAQHNNILKITVFSTLNAIGFYKVNGYCRQETSFHSLPNGLKLECVRMTKNLQSPPG